MKRLGDILLVVLFVMAAIAYGRSIGNNMDRENAWKDSMIKAESK